MSHNCVLRILSVPAARSLLVMLALLVVVLRASAGESTYLIQPGDVLQISVWKEPELQAELLVRSDGGISFPLAGDLNVGGLSVTEVSEMIAGRVKRFVPDIPESAVTVVIKQIGGNRIYVVGKVNRPGEFTFSRPLDVMQALSLASGATSYANLSAIRILRRENGKQVAIRFDYTDVEDGRSLDSNILLRSGDTVVVP